jgi:hypothetical protein
MPATRTPKDAGRPLFPHYSPAEVRERFDTVITTLNCSRDSGAGAWGWTALNTAIATAKSANAERIERERLARTAEEEEQCRLWMVEEEEKQRLKEAEKLRRLEEQQKSKEDEPACQATLLAERCEAERFRLEREASLRTQREEQAEKEQARVAGLERLQCLVEYHKGGTNLAASLRCLLGQPDGNGLCKGSERAASVNFFNLDALNSTPNSTSPSASPSVRRSFSFPSPLHLPF